MPVAEIASPQPLNLLTAWPYRLRPFAADALFNSQIGKLAPADEPAPPVGERNPNRKEPQ